MIFDKKLVTKQKHQFFIYHIYIYLCDVDEHDDHITLGVPIDEAKNR